MWRLIPVGSRTETKTSSGRHTNYLFPLRLIRADINIYVQQNIHFSRVQHLKRVHILLTRDWELNFKHPAVRRHLLDDTWTGTAYAYRRSSSSEGEEEERAERRELLMRTSILKSSREPRPEGPGERRGGGPDLSQPPGGSTSSGRRPRQLESCNPGSISGFTGFTRRIKETPSQDP